MPKVEAVYIHYVNSRRRWVEKREQQRVELILLPQGNRPEKYELDINVIVLGGWVVSGTNTNDCLAREKQHPLPVCQKREARGGACLP
jgi:hypothetical protein